MRRGVGWEGVGESMRCGLHRACIRGACRCGCVSGWSAQGEAGSGCTRVLPLAQSAALGSAGAHARQPQPTHLPGRRPRRRWYPPPPHPAPEPRRSWPPCRQARGTRIRCPSRPLQCWDHGATNGAGFRREPLRSSGGCNGACAAGSRGQLPGPPLHAGALGPTPMGARLQTAHLTRARRASRPPAPARAPGGPGHRRRGCQTATPPPVDYSAGSRSQRGVGRHWQVEGTRPSDVPAGRPAPAQATAGPHLGCSSTPAHPPSHSPRR